MPTPGWKEVSPKRDMPAVMVTADQSRKWIGTTMLESWCSSIWFMYFWCSAMEKSMLKRSMYVNQQRLGEVSMAVWPARPRVMTRAKPLVLDTCTVLRSEHRMQ